MVKLDDYGSKILTTRQEIKQTAGEESSLSMVTTPITPLTSFFMRAITVSTSSVIHHTALIYTRVLMLLYSAHSRSTGSKSEMQKNVHKVVRCRNQISYQFMLVHTQEH